MAGHRKTLAPKILISAGPTREYLDPARFLSNPSTGKMGYALAEAARKVSRSVTLVSGPTNLAPPRRVECLGIETAAQMAQIVLSRGKRADIIILAAAVADYRPAQTARRKIKKTGRTLTLRLELTQDIAATLGERKKRGQILVGFAAETNDLMAHARRKLKKKNLDLVAANLIGRVGSGFASDENEIILIYRNGAVEILPRDTKKNLAERIVSRAVALWGLKKG